MTSETAGITNVRENLKVRRSSFPGSCLKLLFAWLPLFVEDYKKKGLVSQ